MDTPFRLEFNTQRRLEAPDRRAPCGTQTAW
jgi:hypothetical protein